MKKVMLGDGTEDMETLISLETEEKREAMKAADAESYAMGTNILKIENSEAQYTQWKFQYLNMELRKSKMQR